MMTTANCFNDDSLELAARLLCSICREVDASFIIGSLCGSAITNQGSHQTCEAQTSVAPGHFNGGENFVFSGGSCLCNDVHSKVDEGSNKSIGEMESNGSDECHAEVSVQDSNEKKPSLINLFPPSSLITLWRLFVDTSLLEYLKSVASQRNTLSMVPGNYKQSKDISTNRYKNLDRFSLSYLSTRRIAAAVMNAVDLLEDIISNRASNGASHSFTDSTKLLSEVIQLATVESQLRSALYEDTLLESRRLGIGFDISRDHPFDGPSHFVLSKKNAKMDIELYNRSNLKYSHHMLPAEASRGYPFFLLSLKRSNDASYDEFYRRLLNDIADHDLCSLCVKLNDCISSSLLCHKVSS